MGIFRAAFIFLAPESDPGKHAYWIKTDSVHVKTIAVPNYQYGCDIVDALCMEGVQAIELCAGFGHQGVAKMVEAAAGRVSVGVVRFDYHPLLGGVSGDNLFT